MHKPMVNIFVPGSPIFVCEQISQHIDGFRQNNSKGFRIHKTLQTKDILDFFFFILFTKNYTKTISSHYKLCGFARSNFNNLSATTTTTACSKLALHSLPLLLTTIPGIGVSLLLQFHYLLNAFHHFEL